MDTLVSCLVPKSYLKSAERAGLERMSWKFILIETPDALNLVCGPVAEYPYHANLVAQFCDRHQIAASWARKPDIVEIFSAGVHVRGGGHISINIRERRMKLYGRSTAYGPYHPDHLAGVTASGGFFEGFEVVVAGL